jgi:hypothetical protein
MTQFESLNGQIFKYVKVKNNCLRLINQAYNSKNNIIFKSLTIEKENDHILREIHRLTICSINFKPSDMFLRKMKPFDI